MSEKKASKPKAGRALSRSRKRQTVGDSIITGLQQAIAWSRGVNDEVRVIISDEKQTTAYFTFSSQMRPALHQFRIHGTKNGLVLDQDQETLVLLRGTRYKSYLEKIAPSANFAKQFFGNI